MMTDVNECCSDNHWKWWWLFMMIGSNHSLDKLLHWCWMSSSRWTWMRINHFGEITTVILYNHWIEEKIVILVIIEDKLIYYAERRTQNRKQWMRLEVFINQDCVNRYNKKMTAMNKYMNACWLNKWQLTLVTLVEKMME